MWRAVDRGTADGFLPGKILEVRELWLVSRRDAGVSQPGYQSGTSPCVQVRTRTTTKEKYNVEKMFGTDQPMKLVLCDCGGLRLSSGPMTIHFTREEFQVFAESVGRLASIVAQPTLGQGSKPSRSNASEVCH
jgi:hypothetical protein